MNYRDIIGEVPKGTAAILKEAIKLYYGVRYALQHDESVLPDSIATISSLYLAILKMDEVIGEELYDIGIAYEDIVDSWEMYKLQVKIIKEEDYEKVYNECFRDLILKIYTVAKYINKNFQLSDFQPEYIHYYLYLDNMFDVNVVKNMLLSVYGEECYYNEAWQLADDTITEMVEDLDDEYEYEQQHKPELEKAQLYVKGEGNVVHLAESCYQIPDSVEDKGRAKILPLNRKKDE